MFTIPENWKSFTAADLRTLATKIREAIEAAKAAGDMTTEQYAEANALVTVRKEILDLARTKEEFEAADLDPDDEVAPEEFEEEEVEGEEDEVLSNEEPEEDEDEDEETDEDEEVEASVKPKVRTRTGVSTTEQDSDAGAFSPDKLIAKGGITSKAGGEAFTDWAELAAALIEVGQNISPGSSVKVPVATVPLAFDEEHTLGDSLTQNLRKFDREITAAFCAPTINTYDGVLACMNTDRRPVRGSLSAFSPANRGSVSIFPAPSLADITSQGAGIGYGLWDSDDDASQSGTNPAVKKCATVECATPTVYQLYALWRCLTVQNLLFMTFPELVEAYLNRLAAAHARLAETTLLEAMGTNAIDVQQDDLGYGTTTSVTTSIMNLLALAEETERWDNGGMDMWAPRWLKVAMKMDIVRRRQTNGSTPSVPSDSAIDSMFRDAGVTPHWFIDSPSWSPTPPAVVTSGKLNLLPKTVGVVIAPTGKFAVMDRGELNIGVTGNHMYRDNASNAKNQFTFFFENFEALVDTNSCPAYLLTIDDLCHNGIQIADDVMGCNGYRYGS